MVDGAGYSKRSRLDKFGVQHGHRVAVLHLDDPKFLRELGSRTDDLVQRRPRNNSDMIFLGVKKVADLRRLKTLERSLTRAGAIWVLWPKGRKELNGNHVRQAGLDAGLVDIKVAAFSDELSGLKFVIPVARR